MSRGEFAFWALFGVGLALAAWWMFPPFYAATHYTH
jgi:hypothetical protein